VVKALQESGVSDRVHTDGYEHMLVGPCADTGMAARGSSGRAAIRQVDAPDQAAAFQK
jgi:hypothetical protein